MARTIEQLEALEARYRERYFKAQALWKRTNDALVKARKAEEAKVEMDLQMALESHVASGWNERGYNFLNDLTWKGEWKKTGLQATGGGWVKTDQQQVKVALGYRWDDEKLKVLAGHVEKVIPLIRPGMFEGPLKLLSKGSSVQANTLRCLSIFEHNLSENADWNLGLMEDGEWVIFDSRIVNRSYGRARFVGTLMECLREIADHLWYEGGPVQEDW
jgi:hypothetical protein